MWSQRTNAVQPQGKIRYVHWKQPLKAVRKLLHKTTTDLWLGRCFQLLFLICLLRCRGPRGVHTTNIAAGTMQFSFRGTTMQHGYQL